MAKKLEDFYKDLGDRESSGRYNVENPFGFIGKYQMGEEAMVDLGYYKENNPNYRNNDWSGQFTGKDGIYSKQDFLNNPKIQEKAQKEYKKIQWRQLKSYNADNYLGKTVNGIKITQSGLLAAAHLKGAAAVSNYLKGTLKNNSDRFGTNIEEYFTKFSGYDVSEITDLPSDCNEENIDQTKQYSPELIKDVNDDIKKKHNEKERLNKSAKNIDNVLSQKDRILLHSILNTFQNTDKHSNDKFRLNHTLPKVLRAVAKANNLPLFVVSEFLIQSIKLYKNYFSDSTLNSNGRWVTINGNHIFIEKK